MNANTPVKSIQRLSFPWQTSDPFLFCVHHRDFYPEGRENMGPDPDLLQGREMGNDFQIKDGFRMYHGQVVPGFPGHPHRGFETITVVEKGWIDHSDSMGAAGRYGNGDVQWLTSGRGIQHAEMFPLLKSNQPNTAELFQIWINLPKKNKMVEPSFKMLWREAIPLVKKKDREGKETSIKLNAGDYEGSIAPTPTPDSWASDKKNQVWVWVIKMEAQALWQIPQASTGLNRTLYMYEGEQARVAGENLMPNHSAELASDQVIEIENGNEPAAFLLLQGRPIQEPVVQYGPFVMNDKVEVQQAFEDYERTQFGGWPWPKYEHVHAKKKTRFAKYSNGREEIKEL